jgi:DNA repair protein RadD
VITWAGLTFREHQERGVNGVLAEIARGERRVCLTAPTGAGKTAIMGYLIDSWLRDGHPTALYTNRRMLMKQIMGVFDGFGIPYGVRASGMEDHARADAAFQIAMIQTEQVRAKRRAGYEKHRATRVLVDEAHNMASGECETMINSHVEDGAAVVGMTATPLDIGNLYETLVVAGVNSELRRCGMHVPCYVYGPDEPAAALKLKRTKTGEFTEADVVKAIMSPTIFGRVLEHYNRLNPDRLPALLFAPGVKESVWFAEQFRKAGVRSAHIDGEYIWIDGDQHRKTDELVAELGRESKAGTLPVVCNRFVMREGIDWPWLYHGILATIFGSVTSYLQSVGRLLRSYPGFERVQLQDHGGNWWRHGSPNADREWNLDMTAYRYTAERAERMREKKEAEPIVCPKCGAIRIRGPTCATCGHESSLKCRPVIQSDGTLKMMKGDIFKSRPIKEKPDTQRLWDRCYWRCRGAGMTFNQAYGLFFRENGYCPPKTMERMPVQSVDWYAKISNVPGEGLRQNAEPVAS